MVKVVPVLLCGGEGSRLWPLSRENYPKQFLALNPENEKTSLQQTQESIKDIEDLTDPLLICKDDYRFIVAEQMRQLCVKPKEILLEPKSNNTAPAIAVAAIRAQQIQEDALLLVLPTDNEIRDLSTFKKCIQNGLNYAKKGSLITFSVKINEPETSYGYIKTKDVINESENKGRTIEKFIEKPCLADAIEYAKDNKYRWNSGIYLFKASTIISEFERYSPETIELCRKSLKESSVDLNFLRLESSSYKKCPNNSIEYAVLEKTKKAIVLPISNCWRDMGTWRNQWKNTKKTKEGNVSIGRVIHDQTSNCYIRSNSRLIVTQGVENLTVVETHDAILITKNEQDTNLDILIEKIKSEGVKEASTSEITYRPWGSFRSIVNEPRWLIKLIKVSPECSLSLQMHYHRSEHWVVVKGRALVEIEGVKNLLKENESTFIPLGSKHRLTNPGKLELEIIEIQCGSLISEEDIIRFEDNYGRI